VRQLGAASRDAGAASARAALDGASAAAQATARASKRAAAAARGGASAAAAAAAGAASSTASAARAAHSAVVSAIPDPWLASLDAAAHHPHAPHFAAAGAVALLALRTLRSAAARKSAEKRKADPIRQRYGRLDSVAALQEATSSGGDHLALLARVVSVVDVPDCGARIGYFPPALCAMRSIEHVNLSGSAITYLPAGVGGMLNLKHLDVSRCQLRSLPPELGLCAALKHLDASRNSISALPESICDLRELESLNLMGNGLALLPEKMGKLTKLRRLGLKSNRLRALPDSLSRCRALEELYLTDNALRAWPKQLPASLVKIQASFNKLGAFPLELALKLPKLEFLRLASTRVAGWDALALVRRGALPSLAWISLGASPTAAALPPPPGDLPAVPMAQIQVGRLLGGGASGDVYAASVLGTPQMVALKVFRSDVSPDGRTMDEVALSSVVRHPNLPRVRAIVPSSPQAPQIALVMDLVRGGPLADKPNSASLLRCRWPDAALKRHGGYPARGALEVARGVASALAYLHAMGVAHGDVYAHNVLVETHLTRRTAAAAAALAGAGGSQGQLAAYGLGGGGGGGGASSAYATGYRTAANGSSKQDNNNQAAEDAEDGDELTWHATLCDLGAAFCYARDAAGGGGGNGGAATGRGASFWEATEARAYGLLVKDLLERADKRPPAPKAGASRAATAGERKEARESLAVLARVARECLSPDPRQRPTFRAVLNSIDAVSASHAAARAKRRAAAAAEAAVRAKAAREKAAKDQAKAEKAAREAALKAERRRAEMERRNAAELEKARKKAGALDVSAYARLYGHSAR
jgi:hypothetical protein